PLLCGADEVVVADREPVPRALELSGDAVDPLLRRHACGLGTMEHLQPVLVHADHEMDDLSAHAMIARHGVRADLLDRVTHVRCAIRVVDRSRDVEALATAHSRAPASATSRFSSSSPITRRLPSSSFRNTRSRQMSTPTTFSFPTAVASILPSRGNRLRACTYDSCSYVRQHIRRPQHPEIWAGLSDSRWSFASWRLTGLSSRGDVEQQSSRPHRPTPPSSAASSRTPTCRNSIRVRKVRARSRTSSRKSTRRSAVK